MALARKTSRNKPKQRLWEYQLVKKAEKDKRERDEQRYNNLCGPVTITKINSTIG
jgi:hypothetical protein